MHLKGFFKNLLHVGIQNNLISRRKVEGTNFGIPAVKGHGFVDNFKDAINTYLCNDWRLMVIGYRVSGTLCLTIELIPL